MHQREESRDGSASTAIWHPCSTGVQMLFLSSLQEPIKQHIGFRNHNLHSALPKTHFRSTCWSIERSITLTYVIHLYYSNIKVHNYLNDCIIIALVDDKDGGAQHFGEQILLCEIARKNKPIHNVKNISQNQGLLWRCVCHCSDDSDNIYVFSSLYCSTGKKKHCLL